MNLSLFFSFSLDAGTSAADPDEVDEFDRRRAEGMVNGVEGPELVSWRGVSMAVGEREVGARTVGKGESSVEEASSSDTSRSAARPGGGAVFERWGGGGEGNEGELLDEDMSV